MKINQRFILLLLIIISACKTENKNQIPEIAISEILETKYKIELNDSLNEVFNKIKTDITDSNFNYLSIKTINKDFQIQHSFYFNSSLLFEKRAEIISDSIQNLENLYQSLKIQAINNFKDWEIDSGQKNQLLFHKNNTEILLKLNEENIQLSKINF